MWRSGEKQERLNLNVGMKLIFKKKDDGREKKDKDKIWAKTSKQEG